MKTIIAVCIFAVSILSFGAKATPTDSANNLMDAAQAYLNDAGAYTKQGYFMGMVQFYGDSIPNCIPEGVAYRNVNQRVARIITRDSAVLSMGNPLQIMDYAVNKAYPCNKA